MIARLDGVKAGLGCWLFGSLTGPVVVFVLILHNGPTALLGVEVSLKPLLPLSGSGHWAIKA